MTLAVQHASTDIISVGDLITVLQAHNPYDYICCAELFKDGSTRNLKVLNVERYRDERGAHVEIVLEYTP